MNKMLKTGLLVTGTAAATLVVANILTDGAVMDAVKEKLHPAAEVVADAATEAADMMQDAVNE